MEADKKVIQQQIEECLELLKNILGKDLLGVYLYGSALLGGLKKFSDIDLFVISNRETTKEEKIELESALLKISGIYAVSKDLKPVELIIVVKSSINPWRYPPQFDFPKFDFLYGDWLRKEFEAGVVEPWPNQKKMPNLALIITQLLLSHSVLFGPAPNKLLNPVPYKDFIYATKAEVNFLLKEINSDTRNILLTLARMWSTLKTDTIRSKEDAVSWTIERLPNKYKPVLERAKAILLDKEDEHWKDIKANVKPTAEFMISEIKKLLNSINAADNPVKKIKLS